MFRHKFCTLLSTVHLSIVGSRFKASIHSALRHKIERLTDGLVNGNRHCLAQAITLLESTNASRREEGQGVLDNVMRQLNEKEEKYNQYSFRIGFSGPPGAGKSTFIEAFGSRLTGSTPWNASDKPANLQDDRIHRLAVLAIDPSSQNTGGSLLADKTRMPQLSTNLNAYIRPSPSGGYLGGVARATNESILMCEGAGYDTIVVETVGVGQSEFVAAEMVDFFVLIIPPVAGDELQGLKRGIVEVADLVLVNKADGDLVSAARRTATQYSSALKYMRCRRTNWRPKVMLVSSMTGNGIVEFWETAREFYKIQLESKSLQQVRSEQLKAWMWTYIREELWQKFKRHPQVQVERSQIEEMVQNCRLTPGLAAEKFIKLYTNSN